MIIPALTIITIIFAGLLIGINSSALWLVKDDTSDMATRIAFALVAAGFTLLAIVGLTMMWIHST